jgi:hypothetical protein
MAWIPIVVGRKRCGSSRPGALIAGLLLFLVFGIFFFLFFNRSGFMGFNFPIMFWMIGFIMLFIVIFGISIAASAMSKKPEVPKASTYNHNRNYPQQKDGQHPNPYTVKAPVQGKSDDDETTHDMSGVNFCRYCGAKVDRKAKFCYQCGSKL